MKDKKCLSQGLWQSPLLATRAMQAWPGSVRGIRLQDRTPYASYAYDPYGQTRVAAGIPLTVGYTGHLWDPSIQQYFAPFRYYSPATARWTMRDPLGYIDGPNMYGYVKNRPTVFFDLDGRQVPTPSFCSNDPGYYEQWSADNLADPHFLTTLLTMLLKRGQPLAPNVGAAIEALEVAVPIIENKNKTLEWVHDISETSITGAPAPPTPNTIQSKPSPPTRCSDPHTDISNADQIGLP